MIAATLFASTLAGLAIALPPPEFDHPFDGRLIVEVLPLRQVERRCWNVWDRERPLDPVFACSWHGRDRLNPGHDWCHYVIPSLDDRWTSQDAVTVIRVETANCNGWHDAEIPRHD